MSNEGKPVLLISRAWVQAVVLVMILGFFILGILAYQTYTGEPPIPLRVVDRGGQLIFTKDDIVNGQGVFLSNGLMEYGSIFGHGAYLGPDFTADYLHRQALAMQQLYGGGAQAQERVQQELQANRYDPATDTLTWTEGQGQAFEAITHSYETEILN